MTVNLNVFCFGLYTAKYKMATLEFLFILMAMLVSLTIAQQCSLYTISVWHTFESGLDAVFSERGVITVDSVRSDAAAIYTPSGQLSAQQLEKLKTQASAGGFYRLKLVAKSADGTTSELATFGKACQLLEAGLSESLLLTFDHNGRLLAASQLAINRCHGNHSDIAQATPSIKSDILLHQVEVGPSPDTAAFVRRMEEEKLSKQRGEHKDNRSFFAKYWMYIIPVVLLLMITGNSDQQSGAASSSSR